MRTVAMRDEDFAEVCNALVDSVAGKETLIRVLIARFGLESKEVKSEMAQLQRLAGAKTAFMEGPSAWRKSPYVTA